MKTLLFVTSLLVTSIAVALPARAQVLINWGPVTQMHGDADLATNGTYFDAVNTANNFTETAVGTTVFHALSEGTDGAITVSLNGGTFNNDGFVGGSTAYNYVVNQGSDASAGSVTIGTLSNPLTVGDLYQVQIWSVWTGGPYQALVDGDPAAAFDYAPTEFSIGTFTATGTTETFTWTGGSGAGSYGFLNDISVRDLTVAPEPGTWALMLGGFGLLCFVRRLRSWC